MPLYTFDVLPVHPAPLPLESYTSYLTRLAESNGLTRYSDLAERLFPNFHALKVREFTDYTPVSFGRLVDETLCSETDLQATTFFHLARKFGRVPQARSLSLFMVGALSPQLRFCPRCIAEHGCYLLPWRLLALEGCPVHGCALLDHCTACGGSIRLLSAPFQMGICPHCQADLRCGSAPPLSSEAFARAQRQWRDLEFLLLPQSWERTRSLETVMAAGTAFERTRRQTRQSANQVGAQTGILSAGIRAVERGSVGLPGAQFMRYVHYADYLSVSLEQMFTDGLAHYAPFPETFTREQRLEAQLTQAVVHLQSTGQPVDDSTLRVWTGFSLKTLHRHPATHAVLRRLETEALDNRERLLLEQVETAIRLQQAQGKPAYRKDISQKTGVSTRSLKTYPRVHERLNSLNRRSPDEKPTRMLRCEQTLLTQAQQVIKAFLEEGQPVTQERVAAALGLSLAHLHRAYPKIMALLKQSRTLHAIQTDQMLLTQAEAAVQQFHAEHQVVTRKAVARCLGIHVNTLSRYPQVCDYLKTVCDEEFARQKNARVDKVACALDALQAQTHASILTQAVICNKAGFNESAARHHPELKAMMMPLLEAQQAQQRQQLLQRVNEAVATLNQQGKKVSMPAVSQLVGRSLANLRDHPEIVERVRQARLDRRDAYESQLLALIEQAVPQLETADQPLTQKAICTVMGISPNTLRYYRRAKAAVDAIASQYHRECHTPWQDRYRSPD